MDETTYQCFSDKTFLFCYKSRSLQYLMDCYFHVLITGLLTYMFWYFQIRICYFLFFLKILLTILISFLLNYLERAYSQTSWKCTFLVMRRNRLRRQLMYVIFLKHRKASPFLEKFLWGGVRVILHSVIEGVLFYPTYLAFTTESTGS